MHARRAMSRAMLHLDDVSLRIGGELLARRRQRAHPGRPWVGLVGRNGAGKIDPARPDPRRAEPGRGRRSTCRAATASAFSPRRRRAARRPRSTRCSPPTASARACCAERERGRTPLRIAEIETRLDEIDAHARAGRAARILAGLGLDEAMQARPLDDLLGRLADAGGARRGPVRRARPAAARRADQPSRPRSALWLERFLRRYRRTLILVSHDRQLLNAVHDTTLHLAPAAS